MVLLNALTILTLLLAVSQAWADKKGVATRPDVLLRPLIDVPIGLSEALLGADVGVPRARVTTYHTVVTMAWRRAAAMAADCGYGLRVLRQDYDGSNALAPAEAARGLVDQGAWIAMGGSHTTHSLFAATVSGPMPFVAPLTSNRNVESFGENAFGAGIDPEVGMESLLDLMDERQFGKSFSIVQGVHCHSCLKFARAFSRHAERRGYRMVGEVTLADKAPEPEEIARALAQQKFDFLVVPGSMRTLLPTLAAFKDSPRMLRLVGDGDWGGVFRSDFERRPLPAAFEGLQRRDWATDATVARLQALLPNKVSTEFDPRFVSSYDFVILRFFEEVASALCLERPANRRAFWTQSKRWNRHRFAKGVQPGFFLLTRNGFSPVHVPLSSTLGDYMWMGG